MVQMAEVLHPLIPQNTSTSLLQSRPSSSEARHLNMSNQQQQQQQRGPSMPKNLSNGTATGYRGTAAAPTYAFKATPHLKENVRSASSPSLTPTLQTPQPLATEGSSAGNRQRYPGSPSVSTTSSSTSSNPSTTWSSTLFSKDDSLLNSNFEVAPFTTPIAKPEPVAAPIAAPHTPAAPSLAENHLPKPSPDRYRRIPRRSGDNVPTLKTSQPPPQAPAETSNVPRMGQFSYDPQSMASNRSFSSSPVRSEPAQATTPASTISTVRAVEDAQTPQFSGPASMKRYRRKSQISVSDEQNNSPGPERPSSARADSRPPSASGATPSTTFQPHRPDGSQGPARTFADVARRTNTPSPLSRPMSPSDSPGKAAAANAAMQPGAFPNSPAGAALAALNDKDNKGVKHKLRRAFSFGSSAELRRVTEIDEAATRAQARKEQFSSELDEEQDAIARQQEAAGLGHNIYSGQAGFTGSTDNLSISSTASSASMMLRKMGKGMKKGGRSIKGLFRPKSVIGVPPADGPAASVGPVSMVTVEAEREKVNVNAHPGEQTHGGTGFPRLDRNSVDAARASASVQIEGDDARRSIVGGETDRAEVLAAVKRGILKRSTTGTPTGSDPAIMHHANPSIERRGSPVPSNASSEPRRNGHQRTDSVALQSNDDYFAAVPRIGNQSTRSLPGTPGGSRNIKFSPRIVFHDVWSANDYDRRGEIATCNRLTPMLAQQIKEELNTFKMEMEVHELSKPHTHFF